MQTAGQFYDQSLLIARVLGDRRSEANALLNKALILDSLGDRVAAISNANAALEIYVKAEDPHAAKVRLKLAEWKSSA